MKKYLHLQPESTASGMNRTAGFLVLVMLFNTFQPSLYAFAMANTRINSGPAKTLNSHQNSTVKFGRLVQQVKSVRAAASAASVGGPGQSESSGFSLTSTDGLVDKFSGDFTYSIPVADVEGYPIVLTYNSAVGMNTDASWVGLGWDLNVGAVSREMRGLPDEFNGRQTVVRTYHQADAESNGVKFGAFAGLALTTDQKKKFQFALNSQLTALVGRYNDTYLGKGRTFDFGLQASPSMVYDENYTFGPTFGFGYSSDSKRGIGRSFTYGLSAGTYANLNKSLEYTVTNSYSSRQGLTDRTKSFSASGSWIGEKRGVGGEYGASSTVMYGTQTSVPSILIGNRGYAANGSSTLYIGKEKGFLGPGKGGVTAMVGIVTRRQFMGVAAVLNTDHQIIQPAIGYLHTGKYSNFSVTDTQYPIMDFNRTGIEEYSENMKNLPFSVMTYDIFRVNALGIGATFRARRNDFGTIQDPHKQDKVIVDGNNISVGYIDASESTQIDKLNIGLSETFGHSTTDVDVLKKEDGGQTLTFNGEATGNSFDGSVYFKGVGEMTPEDMTDENALGGSDPSFVQLAKSSDGKDVVLTSNIVTNGTPATITNASINGSSEPVVRATSYRPYTAEEYTAFGTNSKYNFYQSWGVNQPVYGTKTQVNRLQTVTPNDPNYYNHIAMVEIVNTSGMKYLFGVPAYDLSSAQVSFCATGLTDNTITTYDPGNGSTYLGDNSVQNDNGLSNYYDKTVVPAVAHSFLLSEVQSPNYVDRTLDGPTPDDVGNYYKFNYTRLYDKTTPYKWRFPIGQNTAYFSKGKLATSLDDMANYAYGEKEIWYTNSVESKNLVAEFVLDDREDACGVNGENGGLNTGAKLKLLSKIVIYNRSERMNPTTGASAVPLQIIEFEYSYDLCRNNPANSKTGTDYSKSGKLTLKSVRSYSGKSSQMGQFAYTFDYGKDADDNVDFSYGADAWGGNKVTSDKPVSLFPYADQNATNANKYAKSWKLKQITNPAGGVINIEYEADSYATVQNKRAMNHVDIEGVTNIYDLLELKDLSTWNGTTKKYTTFHTDMTGAMSGSHATITKNYYELFGNLDAGRTPNNVIIFKMDKTIPVASTDPDAEVVKNYFTGLENEVMKKLFLKIFVNVKSSITQKELVPMFGTIQEDVTDFDAIGVLPPIGSDNFYSYGYVVLKPSLVNENDGHQIGTVISSLQRSAIEFGRRELPDVVYQTCPGCDGNLILEKAVKRNGDVNLVMQQDGWFESLATELITGHPVKLSSLRLYDADNLKYGGNGRVRTITYHDNWQTISNSTENEGVYVWNYKYPDRFTTSGNATAEPNAAMDETDLYQWDTYINYLKKYPDATRYSEEPVAGILLPAPSVGYEEVVVDIEGVENKGYSKTNFYTTHQFPMITKSTSIDRSVTIDEPTSVLLGNTTQKFGMSQGYVVETNDFHGKIKEQGVYNKEVSGSTVNEVVQHRSVYVYAGLDDTHKVIKSTGVLSDAHLAQETDIHLDSRYVLSESVHQQIGINLSIKLPPTGTPIPILLPSYVKSTNTQGFYSSAMVKHINRSAILTEVITETLGSVNSAKNIVYDYQTGNTLLSSLRDEYNDELYSFSYPAYWYYKGLKEYAESQSAQLGVSILSDNTLTSPMNNLLTEGDYIQILDIATQPKVWLAKNVANNGYYLMGQAGNKTAYSITSGTHAIKIIQSNRENRQDEVMQSVVTKHNPISGGGTVFTFPVAEIIQSSAVTYDHRKSIKCGTPMDKETALNNNEVEEGHEFNPYLLGVRGDLVPSAQYTWQSERLNGTHPYKTRFDGTYADYAPFYQTAIGYYGQDWFQVCEADHPDNVTVGDYLKWRKSGVVTAYDPYGTPLEMKDDIRVRSGMLNGYNNLYSLVPMANASAARQQDLGFDGFEDYNYYNYVIDDSSGGTATSGVITTNDRFSFKVADALSTNASLDNTERHSGLYSLKLIHTSSVTFSAKLDNTNHDELSPEDEEGYGYMAETCDCVPGFAPGYGKFVVSGWVKVTDPTAPPGKIVVTLTGGSTATYDFLPSGNIMDGWQRIEGVFTIPNTAAVISVTLQQVSSDEAAYFDDIRFHPFNSGMSTTVYDSKTLLPLATHDAYNYTMFYNYDLNNQLVRMRVETTEGIKTISESEMSGYKQPKQP